MHVLVVAGVLLGGCGRVGYEPRPPPDGVEDSSAAVVDAPAACPARTTEIAAGAMVCIEQAQRTGLPWFDAKTDCEAMGLRLCADAEWATACVDAVGMLDMLDDEWEWVAEMSDDVAGKRGYTSCTDTSSHAVVDPYSYRCCVDR